MSSWNSQFPRNLGRDRYLNEDGAPPGGNAGGVLNGTYPNPGLAPTGVTAGTYGDATHVAQVTVNAGGQVTNATNVAITGFGPTGVFPGTYGQAITPFTYPRFTVGADGRLTSASEVTIQLPIRNLGNIKWNTLTAAAGVFINEYFVLPEGMNQYKLYIAWQDTNGNGGTYEFSGAVRYLGGVCQPPNTGSNGSTLQTVFGSTPTSGAAIYNTNGVPLYLSFKQDTWSATLSYYMIYHNWASG